MPSEVGMLTSDEVDDLIYLGRVGDLVSLKDSIESICKAKSCTILSVLQSAVDIDQEGLGSGSCLLHYPAANGNIEIIQYLLPHISPTNALMQESQAQPEQASVPIEEGKKIINHQNVSGNTPLHWAGMNGHLEVVKALLKAGADASIVNGAGRDAIFESDVSSKEGAAECAVEMLKAFESLEKANGSTIAGDDLAEDGEVTTKQSEA